MTRMPLLESKRLHIRELREDDLETIHRILLAGFPSDPHVTREARGTWLHWTILSYEQLALLYQPPYGERAIVHTRSQEVIGACGLVPSLMPFGMLPSLADPVASRESGYSPEVGLFWAVAPEHQRNGYATEAARALIDYAFGRMHLKRIVATTEYENVASMGVMQRAGMRLERNTGAEPHFMQVVGVRDNL
jgi:RimJ/RimL family protein N-acetyltransferase